VQGMEFRSELGCKLMVLILSLDIIYTSNKRQTRRNATLLIQCRYTRRTKYCPSLTQSYIHPDTDPRLCSLARSSRYSLCLAQESALIKKSRTFEGKASPKPCFPYESLWSYLRYSAQSLHLPLVVAQSSHSPHHQQQSPPPLAGRIPLPRSMPYRQVASGLSMAVLSPPGKASRWKAS
jgi:hypothetical protein